MRYSSRPGENLLDLPGSSGSTLIAVEQTGRKEFWMELDALYWDVIIRRFESASGRRTSHVPYEWFLPPLREAAQFTLASGQVYACTSSEKPKKYAQLFIITRLFGGT